MEEVIVDVFPNFCLCKFLAPAPLLSLEFPFKFLVVLVEEVVVKNELRIFDFEPLNFFLELLERALVLGLHLGKFAL